jgi:DNA gyrase subunit B
MMVKYALIKDQLAPPFLIEYASKTVAETAQDDADAEVEAAAEPVEAVPAKAPKKAVKANREPVEKQTARELFDYVVEQGKKEYQVQRYKGLGEMTAPQLWETTMDPAARTLLNVKLEDIAETEHIFTTLMGEDVEARRKFIEDNALDVKNLDI